MAVNDDMPPSPGGWVADGAAPAGTALSGLDALDLADRPGRRRGRLALRLWNGFWPKILALALVLGVWELVTLSGYNTLESAGIGFVVAIVVGSLIGALVSRIYPLRAAVGSLITGLQTMPSIAWVPFAALL